MNCRRYLGIVPIVLGYPRVFSEFVLHGKASTYKYLLSNILDSLSNTSDEELNRCLQKSYERGCLFLPSDLRIFERYTAATPLAILYYLCRLKKPRVVVETGVWNGKSSWFILNSLSDNQHGRLYSIDLGVRRLGDQELLTDEIGGFVPKSLRDRWSLLIGDAKELLTKLVKQIGQIDIFFHDSSHTYKHMLFEFRTVWPFLAKQGILCSDDVSNNNAWIDFMNEVRQDFKVVGNRMGICYKRIENHGHLKTI